MTKHRFQQLRTACNLFRPYTKLLEQAVQHCCVISSSPKDRGWAFGNGCRIAEVIQHCYGYNDCSVYGSVQVVQLAEVVQLALLPQLHCALS